MSFLKFDARPSRSAAMLVTVLRRGFLTDLKPGGILLPPAKALELLWAVDGSFYIHKMVMDLLDLRARPRQTFGRSPSSDMA